MDSNPYYPVFLDLRGKKTVIVGGGHVAYRKACSLSEAGSRVTVIAPEIFALIRQLSAVECIEREFVPEDLDAAALVVAATDSRTVNSLVSTECAARGIFCNVIDQPDLCTFTVPAVVEKGPISIAISTGGVSPALAKRLRYKLSADVGPEYEKMARILSILRPLILEQEGGQKEHKRIFDILIDSELLELLKKDDHQGVQALLQQAIGIDIDPEELL